MARRRRRDVIDESAVGAYHVYSRTVRRAFLVGYDPVTGRDFSYRKDLLLQRLKDLVSVFAVECLDETILDNHFHAILRNRPDLVAGWSDEEVARRWLRLRQSDLALRPEPKPEQVAELLQDSEKLAEIRRKLSSISCLMAHLKEPLARVSNAQDHCQGAFWQGRFGCERLEDDAALLVCSLYVNMNPIRAGIARTPEEARYTSAYERIQDGVSGDPQHPHSGWLSAVHVDGDGYDGVSSETP